MTGYYSTFFVFRGSTNFQVEIFFFLNVKPIWKSCMLYNSNHMAFWKRQNYRVGKRISGCQELRGAEDEQGEHRGSLGG